MGVNSIELIYLLMFIATLTKKPRAAIRASITDNSKSKICQKGLWDHEDVTDLTIQVDTSGETITDSTEFIMEFEHPVVKQKIEVCRIRYKSDCPVHKALGCFCSKAEQGNYVIQYKNNALLEYGKNFVYINRRRDTKVRLPSVVNEQVTINLKINKRPAVTLVGSYCNMTSFQTVSSKMRLQFCTSGLSSPALRIQHNDSDLLAEDRDCLGITVHAESTAVHFSYKDMCGRNGSYRCHVEVVPVTNHQQGISTDYLLVLLVAALFAAAIFFFIVSGVHRHCGQSKEVSEKDYPERFSAFSPKGSISDEAEDSTLS